MALLSIFAPLLLPRIARVSSATLGFWLSLHFFGLLWVPIFQRVPQKSCLEAGYFTCIFSVTEMKLPVIVIRTVTQSTYCH